MVELQNYQNRHSIRSKMLRVMWNIVWLLLFRPTPRLSCFRRWRVFLLKVFGAHVRWTCNILPSCRVWQPWKLTMGEYSCLSEAVDCYSVDEVIIGDQVTISQGVKLCTAGHDITSRIMELSTRPIVVHSSAWIAAWSIVLPGATLGEGAVVGAGSVVTKDVAPWTVVGGNPAKFIKNRELKYD